MHSIQSAADEIRQGRLSPVSLLAQCLKQIERMEEKVRAWVFVDREGAQRVAEERAAEVKRGAWRGPLHGIPIAIKDIFDVYDWPTACGSQLWKNAIARQDATVVRRLRQAGAVLMGKTVTTQWASFDPPVTRNPWRLDRTPGGSSSGSAAALACGMCLGAMGSQTGGSLTRPASYCGVTTIKPTYCRVSGHGTLTLAHSMDHPGPMARNIPDLAIMLNIIAGPDPLDPTCTDRPVPDYLAALQRERPPRLGRLRGLFEHRAEPEMLAAVDRTVAQLRSAGATIQEVTLPAAFAEVNQRHRVIMAVEALQYHEPRLRQHPEDYGPKISSLLKEAEACPAAEYARCKEHQKLLSQEMLACFHGVDALLCPATAGPAPDAGSTGDPVFNSPWSYTGLPTASFPFAFSKDGLPLAVQFVGRPWEEAEALSVASWCEKAIDFHIGEPKLA